MFVHIEYDRSQYDWIESLVHVQYTAHFIFDYYYILYKLE